MKIPVGRQWHRMEYANCDDLMVTIFVGPLSNRLGGLFAAAGAVVLSSVRNVPWISFPFLALSDLIVAGVLIGIGMVFFTSANWAWAVDLTPPAQAARFLGLTNIATAGTMVITSLLGPLISWLNAQATGCGFTFMVVVAIIGFLMDVGTRA